MYRKKIDIFGYVIAENSRKSFKECSKFYRNKGSHMKYLIFSKIKIKLLIILLVGLKGLMGKKNTLKIQSKISKVRLIGILE